MTEKKESIYPKDYPIGPGELDPDRLKNIMDKELGILGWKIVKSKLPENPFKTRIELYKAYKFEDFPSVMEFIAKVAEVCEVFPHHPRWENTWTTMRVWLTTWDIEHVISYKDIMLARFMDKTYEAFKPKLENEISNKRLEIRTEEFQKEIRDLISQNNLETAFAKLTEYSALNSEGDMTNEITIHMRQYNSIRKSERIAELSKADADAHYNRISQAILNLIDQL